MVGQVPVTQRMPDYPSLSLFLFAVDITALCTGAAIYALGLGGWALVATLIVGTLVAYEVAKHSASGRRRLFAVDRLIRLLTTPGNDTPWLG